MNKAYFVHKARERADGKCSTAEAEEVELIARLVVINNEAIKVADVGSYAFAKGTACEPVKATGGADAIVILNDLIDAISRARSYRTGDFRDVRGVTLFRRFVDLVPKVPSAVGT